MPSHPRRQIREPRAREHGVQLGQFLVAPVVAALGDQLPRHVEVHLRLIPELRRLVGVGEIRLRRAGVDEPASMRAKASRARSSALSQRNSRIGPGSALPWLELNEFDQTFATPERRYNSRQNGAEPNEQLTSSRIPNADPDHPRPVFSKRLALREVLVFRDDHRGHRHRVVPNLPIRGRRHLPVRDVLCFMPQFGQTSGERWGQLRVDEESHQATRRTG